MIKQGLIISIDYTNTYCQVSYFSMRHNRPESVTTDSEVMRYLIPSALTYDIVKANWLIGNAALERAQLGSAPLYTEFLDRAMKGETVELGNKTLTYAELFAIYLGKIVEMAKAATASGSVYNITVNLRTVSREIKETFLNSLEMIGMDRRDVRFLCCAESFAYYVLAEDSKLWQNGALLFDFSDDGFYIRLLKFRRDQNRELVVVEETDCNDDFSVNDLASEILREQLDEKLGKIFEDIYEDSPVSSVYFAGSGFDELWFEQSLATISEKIRAFKGNNIYVKGACQAGYREMSEMRDYPLICKERTKIRIGMEVKNGSDTKKITLSEMCTGWHDAGCRIDLIPDNASWLTLYITSALSNKTETLDFDLEEFPNRPNKATRIEVGIRYLNEEECSISVKDKGFGEFFEASDKVLEKTIRVADYM